MKENIILETLILKEINNIIIIKLLWQEEEDIKIWEIEWVWIIIILNFTQVNMDIIIEKIILEQWLIRIGNILNLEIIFIVMGKYQEGDYYQNPELQVEFQNENGQNNEFYENELQYSTDSQREGNIYNTKCTCPIGNPEVRKI